jgi:hypothetical protein
MRLAAFVDGQNVVMPIRDIPSSPLVLTSYDGRWWISEVERVGPVRGSFVSKEAAVSFGRALTVETGTTRIAEAALDELAYLSN